MGGIGSGRIPDHARHKKACALRDKGWTFERIGKELGISARGVSEMLKRAGYKAATERQLEAIKLREQGWSFSRIGRHLGISGPGAYSLIERGGHWLHPSVNDDEPRSQRGRTWCLQCERLVLSAEANQCASPFCKAKAVAA